MPGPVSDSYDPEFGTGHNAGDVREAVAQVRALITEMIGETDLANIVEVAQDPAYDMVLAVARTPGNKLIRLTERHLRVIRFCLDRATESL